MGKNKRKRIIKGLFRIIQSIPSPKAEPFKLWLARVGYQRIQEIQNSELIQKRMKEFPKAKTIAKRGGGVAGIARIATEKELGRKVSTKDNYLVLPEKQRRLLKSNKPKKKIKYGISKKNQIKSNIYKLFFTILYIRYSLIFKYSSDLN